MNRVKPLIVCLLPALILVGCAGAAASPTEAPTSASIAATDTALPVQPATEQATAAVTEAATVQPTEPATSAPTAVAQNPATCPQTILTALTDVDRLCSSISRNQVCYGNTRLAVSPDQANFARPGDLANIASIQRLSLELDPQAESWGVALMSLQANLPDTLPGQNVTVVLFGNVQFDIDNGTSDTQAFVLKTGIGDAPCPQAPDSGLLVQTPQGGREVSFRLNGADIRLGSTAYFQASPGADLVTSVIEGAAQVTSQGVTRIVPAGLRSTRAAGCQLEPPPGRRLRRNLMSRPISSACRWPISAAAWASPRRWSSSLFDSDAENWTIADDSGTVTAEQRTDSASGNGILCGVDSASGDNPWYFSAPDSWLSGVAAAYGGLLVYGQNQGEVDNQLDNADKLLLVGSDGSSLSYNPGANPAADYSIYKAPLIEAAGWLHPGTNIRATEPEFQQVLSNLSALRILGKYRRGENTSCLDFVLDNQALPAELSNPPTEPILDLEFDSDAEGWTTTEGGSTPIEHDAAGYVCGTDQDFIDAWYFSAGPQWLGDQSAAYGGSLVYELKQSATDGIQNTVPYNVSLIGRA